METQDDNGVFYKPRWQLKSKNLPHPSRRWCHTATIYKNNLFILGGRLPQSAKSKEYVYKVDCQTFQSEQIILSEHNMMRESHSATLVNDSVYVLFGMSKSAKVLSDCLKLDITSSSLIMNKKQQKTKIQPRESHMSVLLNERYILIYGGVDHNQKLTSDFYLFDLLDQSWRKIEQIQGERIDIKVGGVMVGIKNQIYLFGGQKNDQNQYSNQIYKIQIKYYQQSPQHNLKIIINKINISGPKPKPRSQFASVTYKDRYLIIVGGQGSAQENSDTPTLMNDIWAYDTERNLWEELITQNSQLFKPRSSFTASVYKQSLIIFGGLISFKDFRTSDQLFVLHLNTDSDKKPICNICKSSYRVIPRQQPVMQRPISKIVQHRFSTSLSTIFAISQTIIDPFKALGTLLHGLDFLDVEKCLLTLDVNKLSLYIKKINITEKQWKEIYQAYDFKPLIHESDERMQRVLLSQVRQHKVNYFSYNLKNTALRLGNQFLISWVNHNDQLQLCYVSKFGIFHTINLNIEQKQQHASHFSIILQFLKENNLSIQSFFENSMTIIVTSLKKSRVSFQQRQMTFDSTKKDVINQKKISFRNFMNTYFTEKLSFKLAISQTYHSQLPCENFNQINPRRQSQKKQHQIQHTGFFSKIFTYEITETISFIMIYQNNKLMHKKQLKNDEGMVYQFHLNNKISPNLTFTDVLPTQQLLISLQKFVEQMRSSKFKRKQSAGRLNQNGQDEITPQKQQKLDNLIPKKVIKTVSFQPDEQENEIKDEIEEFTTKE